MTRKRANKKQPAKRPPPKPRKARRLPIVAALGTGLLALLLIAWLLPARLSATPNVLLITTDTTRADFIGCYGDDSARTPVIDRLAHEGVLFRHCDSCVSMTLPSHSSIMTGDYPFVHGVRRNATDRLADANELIAETFSHAGYNTDAVVGAIVLNKQFGLDQGFDQYRDMSPRPGLDPARTQRPGNEVCDEAIQLMQQAASKPFFLWVHFYDPHYPYESHTRPAATTEEAYADEISFVDTQVGRLMTELRQLGIDDNTIVIIVGDHGEGLGHHNEWMHGFFVYQSTIHVPLIFWAPGRIDEGRIVDRQVRTIDIAPTILDLLHLPPLDAAQGVSLTAFLEGGNGPADLPAYAEALEGHSQLGLAPLRSLTVESWKYVLAPKPALYDLDADPDENNNVIAQQPEIAAELHDQLRDIIAKAPAAPTGDDTTVTLSSEDIARLESLGYVATVSDNDKPASELDLFDPTGLDPRDYTDAIRAYEEARLPIKNGKFAEAENKLRRVIKELPDAGAPQGDLAQVLRQEGRIPEAMKACRRALELEPGAGHIRLMYGQLLMDAGRFEPAVDQLTEALLDTPKSIPVLYNLGVALTALHRYEEARRHFEAALQIEPNNIRVLQGLAVHYIKQNRLAEAADVFRRALQIAPNHPRLRQDYEKLMAAINQQRNGN